MMEVQIGHERYKLKVVRGRLLVDGRDLDYFTDAVEHEIIVADHGTPSRIALATAQAVTAAWRNAVECDQTD